MPDFGIHPEVRPIKACEARRELQKYTNLGRSNPAPGRMHREYYICSSIVQNLYAE